MIENTNKGGRPSKDFKDRKIFLVSTRLDAGEYETFQRKVEQSGFSASDFVRRALLDSVVRPRFTPEEFQLYKDLGKDMREIGNNLNQLSRNSNTNVVYRNLKEQFEIHLQAMRNFVDIYKQAFDAL